MTAPIDEKTAFAVGALVLAGASFGVWWWRARRRHGPSEYPPREDVERLREELRGARDAGDAARVQSLEDRLRIVEYWDRKRSGGTDRERVRKQPESFSDWNTSEKRFNNLR